VEERNIALPIIAGIVAIALVVGYAGYCYHATAEMIKLGSGTDLQRSFERSPPGVTGGIDADTLPSSSVWGVCRQPLPVTLPDHR
jgi:hypothetical protein